jgi:Cytochrome c
MVSNLFKAFAFGAFVIGVSGMANAQQSGAISHSVDVGKLEYDSHCVACHGPTGKGDGPFVPLLKPGTVVANLTEISKKNNGIFPFLRVYQTIDGSARIAEHGPKDMPIWGSEFKTISSGVDTADTGLKVMEFIPYNDPQNFAHAKMLALTEYVYRLQAK